jgi:hypothetical protein
MWFVSTEYRHLRQFPGSGSFSSFHLLSPGFGRQVVLTYTKNGAERRYLVLKLPARGKKCFSGKRTIGSIRYRAQQRGKPGSGMERACFPSMRRRDQGCLHVVLISICGMSIERSLADVNVIFFPVFAFWNPLTFFSCSPPGWS